jgi:hypothetical protein
MVQQHWTKDLPNWLGLLITSRPEYQEGWPTAVAKINTEDHRNAEDIASFLRIKLANYAMESSELEAMVAKLLELSGGLFLYMRFLDDLLDAACKKRFASSGGRRRSLGNILLKKDNRVHDHTKLTVNDLVDLPQVMIRKCTNAENTYPFYSEYRI